MTPVADRFCAALRRRRLGYKEAARLAGCLPRVLQRIGSGDTTSVDADLIDRLARALGPDFLTDVFGAGPDPLAAVRADLDALRRRIPAAPDAWWFDEHGRRIAGLPDLDTAARHALNLPTDIDAHDFATRTLGWVAVVAGEMRSGAFLAPLARAAAQEFMSGAACGDLPSGWQISRDAARPDWGNVDPRDLVSNPVFARRAALYRVEPNAVVTLWLGRDLKTDQGALGLSLRDRTDHRFADLLERQIRATVREGVATGWHLENVETAGVRATWDRVAVPSACRRFVAHVVEFKEMETVA